MGSRTPTSVGADQASRQGETGDRATRSGSTPVDLPSVLDQAQLLQWVRDGVDAHGWGPEALSAHIYGADRDNKAYISKVLRGEKPLSGKFLRDLPDEVEIYIATKWCESFGLLVVAPAADAATAARHLVSGLLGLVGPQLPLKASRMATAQLSDRRVADRRVG